VIAFGLAFLLVTYILLARAWVMGVRPFTRTCDKCGGYVDADGCPCGATDLRGLDPAEARRPCDAVVNGMGPYPEPWRVRCHACGEVFGVNRAGSVVRCLCSRQTLSWVDCQKDRRACGA